MDIRTLLRNLDREVFWDTYAWDIISNANNTRHITNSSNGGKLSDVIPYNIDVTDTFLSFRIMYNGFSACGRNIGDVIFSEVDEDIYDFVARVNGMVKNGYV